MGEMSTESLPLLIFDLDGVITSEEKYWNTARLTVWEMITSEQYLGIQNYFGDDVKVSNFLETIGDRVIPDSFIYEIKRRAINSNWDLTFFVFYLHLISLLTAIERERLESLLQFFTSNNAPIIKQLQKLGKNLDQRKGLITYLKSEEIFNQFLDETYSKKGSEVLEHIQVFANKILEVEISEIDQKGELWQLCYQNFQNWYQGEKGDKIPGTDTILPLDRIDSVLETLKQKYTLAIATGRPRKEVVSPFKKLNLLHHFDPDKIVTYDEVVAAESLLQEKGYQVKLGKPHPFVLYKAACPNQDIEVLCREDFQMPNRDRITYIGDSGSDIVAAQRAGCLSIGVMTGFFGKEAKESKRQILEELGCKVILESILELPQWLNQDKINI